MASAFGAQCTVGLLPRPLGGPDALGGIKAERQPCVVGVVLVEWLWLVNVCCSLSQTSST